MAGLLPLVAASAQAPGEPAGQSAAARPKEAARVAWTQAMRKLKRPEPGCYTATYPDLKWNAVTCGKAPDRPLSPATGPGVPFTIGGGNGDFSAVTSGQSIGGEGSFLNVSAGITETGLDAYTGLVASNVYTLQLNTDFFQTTACAGSPNTNCRGWEQFAYENTTNYHRAFIQYWLIKYNATCPAGWSPWVNGGNTYCYFTTPTTSLPASQPVANLGSMSLSGQADSAGDQVTIVSGTNMATRVGSNKVPPASSTTGWHFSEFNVFGDGGGTQANFGPNTTMTVQTLTHSGTTLPPTCFNHSFTGETNNLSLVGTAPIPTLASPGIRFNQSNIPGSAASCQAAFGLGDTHLLTFGGLYYDFQATGDFTLAQSGGFEVQSRQISGAPNWPNAAVNEAVAARLGKNEVAVCTPLAPALKQDIFINGAPRPMGDGDVIDLGDGSGVRRVGNLLVMVDPRGNSLNATLNTSHINANVGLGQWPVRVAGLLASSGRSGTQLTSRGGAVLNAPYPLARLYGQFGDSWRVQPRRSMLKVCGRAKQSANPTASFTSKNLDRGVADAAREVCLGQGIKDERLLEACIIDVAMLGKDGAEIYGHHPVPKVFGRAN